MDKICPEYKCAIGACNFETSDNKKLLRHYYVIHGDDPHFKSTCFIKECGHKYTYLSASGLYQHMKQKHSSLFSSDGTASTHGVEGFSNPTNDDIFSNDGGHTDQGCPPVEITHDVVSSRNGQGSKPLEKASAQFVLRLLEGRKLNQADIEAIMKETEELVTVAITEGANFFSQNPTEANGSPQASSSAVRSILPCELFPNLSSQHSRLRYFTNNLGMIRPIEIFLPELPQQYDNRRKKDNQIRRHSYVYVSLLETLSKLLCRREVYENIYRSKNKVAGNFASFEDGTEFSSSPFFQEHQNAIQLHIYLDEVELCKPLGSKKHKVVFMYFCVGNIEAKYRSSLRQIHLLAIFYNSLVNQYGINKLLEPVITDIKKLEQGFDLQLNERMEKIYGTLVAVCSDNLASHTIGGFKKGFGNAFRFCRTCLGTRDEIQSKFTHEEFLVRTRESHDLHCEGLNTQVGKHFEVLYGICFHSSLNELENFHVIGGLVPDIMHDILEGCLGLTISELLLRCVVRKKYFTVDILNFEIANFIYGTSESKDKPSKIEIEHVHKRKLRQSAAQIWLLAVTLPLLVGKFVPRHDKAWKNFTVLLEMCQFIFKEEISSGELHTLDFLIWEYLLTFKRVFARNIIPKQHFLVHYTDYIRRMGPLVSFWCMRYEAKHSYFKQLIRKIGNFKNISLTLSVRHQQWVCNNFLSDESFLENETTVSPKFTSVLLSDTKNGGQIAAFYELSDLNKTVESFSWIKRGSIHYSCGDSVLLCPLQGSTSYQFGLLVNIYRFRGVFAFSCQLLNTERYDFHFQAYKLSSRKDSFQIILSPNELADYRVRHLHKPKVHRNEAYPDNKKTTFFVVTKVKLPL